jgi:hypothetical protein
MSICLGIDLGAHLGYAVGDSSKGPSGTLLACDVVDLGKRAKQLRCSRNTALYAWVLGIIKEHGVEVYCREDSTKVLRQEAARRGAGTKNLTNALEHHAGYAAVLDVAAETKKLRIIDAVDPRTLKKFACDNGNAKKPQMLNAAQLLYRPLAITDENAGDAAHVCAWAMQQVRRAGSLPF